MQTQQKKLSPTTKNLIVDSVIFSAFLVVTAPQFTGFAIHEWLGMAFGAGIITHLLLHWSWLVATTQRLFSNAPRQARINYALNLLLFIDMTLVIFTGLMISQSALPALGINLAAGNSWRMVHTTTANLSLALIGLHVAFHWQWVANAIRNYVVKPVAARLHLPQHLPRLHSGGTKQWQKEA